MQMLFLVWVWFGPGIKFIKVGYRWYGLLLIAPSVAFAAYVPAYTILNDAQEIEVQANGGYTLVREHSIRIDTPQGIDQYGQAKIAYDGKRDRLDIVEAYTIKPNGEKVMVSLDKIKRQSQAADDIAPYFTDAMVAVIIFPQVEVGSQLYYKSVLVESEPRIKGHFADMTPFMPNRRYEYARISLTHPSEIEIQAYARGVEGSKSILPDGRTQYRYSYRQDTAYPLEPNQVDYEDFSPVLQFSNYKGYAELAKITQDYFQPKTQVTPMVQALANELTQGIASPRKKAQKLYDWVSANIRYVGIDVGSSGYEPHFADEILANRYGDCKDHAVILEALLMAVGIPSSPVLIRTTDSYELPHLAGDYYFDHAISYVLQFNLYLDSTAQFAEFGTLPISDMGKPALITKTGEVGQTPSTSSARDHTVTRTKLRLMPDGSITGRAAYEPHGYYVMNSRVAQFSYENRESQTVVDSILNRFQETGTGELTHADPTDLAAEWGVESRFKLDPVINLPGPSAFSLPSGLAPNFIRSKANIKPYAGRRYPFSCGSSMQLEYIEMDFPGNVRVSRVPKGVSIRTKEQSYQSSYRLVGKKLFVTRELATNVGTDACKPSSTRYKDQVYLLSRVKADLRSQIFVD